MKITRVAHGRLHINLVCLLGQRENVELVFCERMYFAMVLCYDKSICMRFLCFCKQRLMACHWWVVREPALLIREHC